MTLADLYLVGAPKAGTTSVASWLGQHPDVFWSTPKEPFYWAADYPRMRAHYGFDTRASYERLYRSPRAAAATVRGDGSTTYLYSRTAIPDILAAQPDARFIVCLRDPLDMLVSYHRTQLVALNETEGDFGTAWRRSLDGGRPETDPLDPKLVDYPLVGRLGAAIGRLLTTVARERVHFVLFDDLVNDPSQTWRGLTEFLGIPTQPEPSFDVHNASNKAYRSAVLRRLTHRPPALLEAPIRVLRQWSRTTANPLVAVGKARMWRSAAGPRVSDEVRSEVAEYLRADVDRLATLLERSLPEWASAGR